MSVPYRILLRKSHDPSHDVGHSDRFTTSVASELEEKVTKYLSANPHATRSVAVNAVFSANPGLYDRVRNETTHARHGQVIREMSQGEVSKSGESVDEEVARRVEQLMSKTAGATREQALAFVFREHPELAERWMRESYA
jgi:hypothetical protein